MNAKERLLQFLDYKSIKKAEFYKKTGLSNGFLDKNANISSDKIEIISSFYAELNLHWLITGFGDMLRAADGESTTVQAEPTIIYRDNPKDIEIMQLLREQNAQLKEQIAELKKPKFCGIPINMSNTPPAEPSSLAVAEGKPTPPKPPKKIPTKSEIHT